MVGGQQLMEAPASFQGELAPCHRHDDEGGKTVLGNKEQLASYAFSALLQRLPDRIEDLTPEFVKEVLARYEDQPAVTQPPFRFDTVEGLTCEFTHERLAMFLHRKPSTDGKMWLEASSSLTDGIEGRTFAAATEFVLTFEVVSPQSPAALSQLVLRKANVAGADVAIENGLAFRAAAYAVLSEGILICQSIYHLFYTHVLIANNMVLASSTELPPDNPLRRLLVCV
jgi:hypothetical protein